MKRTCLYLAASAVVAALLCGASPASAQVSPNLGTAATYTVLGTNTIPTVGTVTCTDTGPGTAINGNVGSTFSSITNTGCTITGSIDRPVAGSVVTDFNAAYAAVDALNPCTGVIPTVTATLAPGVYCSAAGTTIGAGVILTLNGTASDVWVFRVGTGGAGALALTSAQVVMGGAALECNVYWKTAQAATLTDSTFVGTVLSGTAVTMTRGSWFGRALATTDATMTDAAPLTFAGCSAPASITVNKDFIPNSAATVPVALTCTSGTVTTTPLNASEAAPAVFTVGGASLGGATCTATETVPAGYTANQASCASVALNGSCTITNTATPPTIAKAFSPASITAGGVSRLTITVSNPNAAAISLTAALTDTLPTGVLVATVPNATTTCGGAVTAAAGGSTVTLATGSTIPAGSCAIAVDVTAAAAGTFVNTIAAGALQTTAGNNVLPATAPLAAIGPGAAPPTITKAFSPVNIAAGGVSTLTITVSNSNAAAIGLTAALTDTLPSGMLVAAVPNATTTCGGAVTAAAGGSTVTLATLSTIPSGSCTITVDVTAATGGGFMNTIPAGALQTNAGNNALPAIAVLSVAPPVPTLSEWAFIMLTVLLAASGVVALRRRTSA